MKNDEIPNVGDYLIRTKTTPAFADGKHGSVGEVYRVIRVGMSQKSSGVHVFLDHCSCEGSADHHEDFSWTWHSYADLFERYTPITPEEADKAKPLPTMEDVESFFRRA